MASKRQWVSATDGALVAAVVFSVVRVFEESLDDPDPWATYTDLELDPGRWGDVIDVRLWGGAGGVGGEVEIEDRGVVVRVSEGRGLKGRPLASLYSSLAYRVAALDSGLIRELAWETSRTGVEYILIYLPTGSVAVLEGEVLRVDIPFVESVGQIHTHPSGACALSRADVESGLDSLAEGAIFEAVATDDCIFYMARVGLVGEDDYIRVKGLVGDLSDELDMGSLVFARRWY